MSRVKISPSNQAAVNKALAKAISAREAKALIKTVGGRDQKVGTANELKQLKAIAAKHKDAFTPAAKKAIDKEISAATKRVAERPVTVPSRPLWGGGGSGGGGGGGGRVGGGGGGS